jgi:HEXXH motif-containing protein
MRRTSVHVHFEAARHVTGPDRARHLLQGYASLLTELALSGGQFDPVELVAPEWVVARGQRRRLHLGAITRFAPGVIASDDSLGGHEPVHVPIDGDVCLALCDDNPLAMNEAHPDKEGNALDLGGHPIDEWLASLKDALDRIATYLPLVREEMALGLQQLVPVGFHAEKHLSASYREALGTVYLSLHPDAMTMTEAVIHEFQHNKLNAALDLDPFLSNAFDERVVSPVRPDPRPLHGVLLAVHAFLPVAELYLRMRDASDPLATSPRFVDRLHKIVRGNHEGLTTTLAHARPTAAGRILLDEMVAIDRRHRGALDSALA